jgi:hypothetical protein
LKKRKLCETRRSHSGARVETRRFQAMGNN